MYFFPGLHIPGLTSVTNVVGVLFVRVAQFQERAEMAARDSNPRSSDTRRRGRNSGSVGVGNVSSDSSLQPHAPLSPRKRKHHRSDPDGRRCETEKEGGCTVPGTWGPWTLWRSACQVHLWRGNGGSLNTEFPFNYWLNTQHPDPPSPR